MKLHNTCSGKFLPVIACMFVFLTVYSCGKPTMGQPASDPSSTIDTTVILTPTPDTINIPPVADTINIPPVPDTINIPPAMPDSLITYLALGDSYTIGQSVPEAERFPNQTVQLLKKEGIKIGDPKIIAVTGWTTGNLINVLNYNPPANNYSLVSLLIGVNNQYQQRSIDEYKTEFTLLLNRSIAYAGNIKEHVFVLSIPDYSVTPFAHNSDTARISKEIDLFNAANKAISKELGVTYLDITPISREAVNDNTLIAGDGLHPSGKQYQRWAELLAPLMKEVIKDL